MSGTRKRVPLVETERRKGRNSTEFCKTRLTARIVLNASLAIPLWLSGRVCMRLCDLNKSLGIGVDLRLAPANFCANEDNLILNGS